MREAGGGGLQSEVCGRCHPCGNPSPFSFPSPGLGTGIATTKPWPSAVQLSRVSMKSGELEQLILTADRWANYHRKIKMSRKYRALSFFSWKNRFVFNSVWDSEWIEIKLMSWTCTKFINEEEKSYFMLCKAHMASLLPLLVVKLFRKSNVPWQHCVVESKDFGSSGAFTFKILQRNLPRKAKPENNTV